MDETEEQSISTSKGFLPGRQRVPTGNRTSTPQGWCSSAWRYKQHVLSWDGREGEGGGAGIRNYSRTAVNGNKTTAAVSVCFAQHCGSYWYILCGHFEVGTPKLDRVIYTNDQGWRVRTAAKRQHSAFAPTTPTSPARHATEAEHHSSRCQRLGGNGVLLTPGAGCARNLALILFTILPMHLY